MAVDRHGRAERVKVLLDANALMMPVQFGIDLFDELGGLLGAYETMVLPEVIEELKGLAKGKGRDSAAARFGMSLVDRCTVVEKETMAGSVDEKILCYAKRHGCMVVTNDRQLRNALISHNISVISIRKKKKLDIVRR